MPQYQELISIAPWEMISQLCNLLILTLLVKKFLFKPVQKILAERQAAADAVMAEARSAREQAQAMQAEYEQRNDKYERTGFVRVSERSRYDKRPRRFKENRLRRLI